MRRIVRLAGALATIALAAGMTLAGTGTARADVIPPASGWAEIFSPYLNAQGFSLCFDDPNGSTSRGTGLQLYHCHGYASNGAPQRWVFIQPEDNNGNLIYDQGHPVYEIYNLAAGLCLTAPNLAAGTQLTMDTCNRTIATGQIWWELPGIGSPAGPNFEIFPWPVDFTYNRCVAASNLTSNNNTRLVMEPCDGSTGRVFQLG
jgi:Ricin-type beta-trefoil lectin domain